MICSDVTRLIVDTTTGFSVKPEVSSQLHTIDECPPESSGMEPVSSPNTTPPPEVRTGMRPDCQAAFCRMWERIPAHLWSIIFGLQHDAWSAEDINRQADVNYR